MVLLTHNFSKLPHFPCSAWPEYAGQQHPRGFHPSCISLAIPLPSPAAGLRGLKGLFLSRALLLLAPRCCRDKPRVAPGYCPAANSQMLPSPHVVLLCLGLPQSCPLCPTGDKRVLLSA